MRCMTSVVASKRGAHFALATIILALKKKTCTNEQG